MIYTSCRFAIQFNIDHLKLIKKDHLHLSHKQLTEKNILKNILKNIKILSVPSCFHTWFVKQHSSYHIFPRKSI